MTDDDGLTRDYRAAFLGYLPRREEAALNRGYELGRSAVAEGMSLLELAQVHHVVLLETMSRTPAEERPEIGRAAAEFFLEVLAMFELTQRAFQHRSDAGGRRDPRPGSEVTAPRPRAGVVAPSDAGDLRPAGS